MIPRLLTIWWVALKYRLDRSLPIALMPWYLRAFFYTFRIVKKPNLSEGESLSKALESLGPVFVKLGQLLSTRQDLLSEETATALAQLQDQVAPFDSELAREIIEKSLGDSVDRLFYSFEPSPMASASIAQVHAATLLDLTPVVVKVVRPGITKVINKDLKLIRLAAKLIQAFHPDGKRLRPVEVVDEYEYTLMNELDLKREAANASQLKRNFESSDLLEIPEVYWPYCRENVLVSERIDGIPVSDIVTIDAMGISRKQLAERGVEIFFRQVFEHSFFHADMHPGNIFVAKKPIDPPLYMAIDCAIVGSLDQADQYYVARCLLAIFKRDYRQVAKIHVETGWVNKDIRLSDFEAAIRSVCEPIFEKPLAEISFAELLLYLFQTARRFDMTVQPELMLLQKTLLHVEGLGKQLYPDLDLWDTALPFLERWIKARYSPTNMLKQAEYHLPDWLEHLPELPDLVYANLLKNKDNEVALHRLLEKQSQSHARMSLIFCSALMFVSLLFFLK